MERKEKKNQIILFYIDYETNITPKNEGILQDYGTDRKKNLPRPRGKPEGNKKVSEVDTGQGGKIWKSIKIRVNVKDNMT